MRCNTMKERPRLVFVGDNKWQLLLMAVMMKLSCGVRQRNEPAGVSASAVAATIMKLPAALGSIVDGVCLAVAVS